MSSVASPLMTRRAILLVALMVLMGQAGYFQSGYWMNDGESAPVEPLARATDGPMAAFSTDAFPNLDADLRAGDLTDWTFWRPNATDNSGTRGGFDTFNSALPDANGNGQAYYAGHGSAYTASSSELGGTSVTDGMLLFTHYGLDNGAVHTASANLSLNLPASAFLSFTAVTKSDGWNDSLLDVAVYQSGSQISHTTVEPGSANLESERVTVSVPAGSSTVTISTSVESTSSYWYGAGGFWGVHSFLVGGAAT
ncbi:MAG: hypothetical protein L7U48_06190, partial [Candidatus Poseidoniaceae archaeon]|nr:hypothetical protein [Candidatus Poseidoniaceae archaeon]